jgi:Zn-dependent protease
MLIQLLFTEPILFLMIAIAIIFALSIHEYFHAWTANFLGDPTAKLQGRLTINPLAHLDPMGTLLLLIVGIGWGKPVPFNPYNLKNQKQGELLVGLAGPASNLLMALTAGLLLRFFPFFSQSTIFPFLFYFVWINIILGIFNLLPVPPLDGYHVLFNFLPASMENIKMTLLRSGPFLIIFVILFMVFIGFPYICQPLFQLITGLPLSL